MTLITVPRLWPLVAGVTLMLLGCATQNPPAAGGMQPLGLIEVSFEQIGSADMTSRVRPLALPEQTGGLDIKALSVSVFDVGPRNAGGVRYITATYAVRNAAQDGTASATARSNLTLIAVGLPSNVDGTAVSTLTTFGGSAASAGVARSFQPTHAMQYSPLAAKALPSGGGEDLQVFTESEVQASQFSRAGVPVSSYAQLGVQTVFPYGYVVDTPAGGRTLAANPVAGQYDGRVALSVKLPLQPDDAQQTPPQGNRRDPWAFRLTFLVVEDPNTRITQSLDEQALGSAPLLARAAGANATLLNTLPGTGYVSAPPLPSRLVCQVRTADLAGSPTAAYLVNVCP
ncbi:hypothetical protein [Deinococcus sp. QL22]|uniref:hypothetical protein n=1 Tax=Deinococcus sp. QL22 TaxID=2939437 RepID=UPI002016DA8D|nr:hypothetical protein [Deinococcus sp. QL22]UQN09595.1 hypothetical protein M1R55_25960 [Deinococcus sp. QL22]